MPSFTIRVVLHGATAKDYELLHNNMASAGCARIIRGDNGVIYDLPDGEYDYVGDATAHTVRDSVAKIASAIRPSNSVLVTEAASRSWKLLPVPGAS